MEVQVNKALCNGCGSCISVCPAGAISLVDGFAEINRLICTQCQVCIRTCPLDAISFIELPQQQNLRAMQVIPEQETIIAEPISPPAKLQFSSVLSSIGSAVLPRLVNILIDTFERHLTQGDKKSTTPASQNPTSSVRHSGRGYQHRNQGRHQSRKTNGKK